MHTGSVGDRVEINTIDLCMVNARIKGVPPGNRASPSIIERKGQ